MGDGEGPLEVKEELGENVDHGTVELWAIPRLEPHALVKHKKCNGL